MHLLREAVPFQPANRGIQLSQRHLSPALVAKHAFEGGVVAMVEPGPNQATPQACPSFLVLDSLCCHHLT